MIDIINPNCLGTKFVLIIILLVINLCLKLKSLRAPLDYDTSNHLYYAFLKNHKVPFISSYGFGVKYFLSRLYTVGKDWIKNNPHRFRIFNIFSSSLLIIFWVLLDPFISNAEIPFYFLGVLPINSLWINYMTSASEFHSVALIMVMFLLPEVVSLPMAWILQLVLLAFLIGGFKIINITYLLPVLAFYSEQILDYKWWFGFGLLFFGLYVFRGFKSTFLSTKQYISTRRWLNLKSATFVLRNPHFCLLLVLLGIGNIFYVSWQWALLQLVIWGILLVQRYYTGYFFYPSVVLGLFIAFQTQWLDSIPIHLSLLLVLAVFVGHTFWDILIRSPREIIIRFRKLCIENWRTYLDKRDLQVQWLKKHLEKGKYVYLWGSEVSLLLLAKLLHSPNTYYSHNHLIYWSNIEDKQNYAVNYLLKEKPKYVIEYAIIENIKFPKDKLKGIYTQIGSVENMNVYERKN